MPDASAFKHAQTHRYTHSRSQMKICIINYDEWNQHIFRSVCLRFALCCASTSRVFHQPSALCVVCCIRVRVCSRALSHSLAGFIYMVISFPPTFDLWPYEREPSRIIRHSAIWQNDVQYLFIVLSSVSPLRQSTRGEWTGELLDIMDVFGFVYKCGGQHIVQNACSPCCVHTEFRTLSERSKHICCWITLHRKLTRAHSCHIFFFAVSSELQIACSFI